MGQGTVLWFAAIPAKPDTELSQCRLVKDLIPFIYEKAKFFSIF